VADQDHREHGGPERATDLLHDRVTLLASGTDSRGPVTREVLMEVNYTVQST